MKKSPAHKIMFTLPYLLKFTAGRSLANEQLVYLTQPSYKKLLNLSNLQL